MTFKIDLDVAEYVMFLESLNITLTQEAFAITEKTNYVDFDYGATKKNKQDIDLYLMALNKEIPKRWKAYLDDFKLKMKAKKSKEYAEYLRLKNKFEGENNGI